MPALKSLLNIARFAGLAGLLIAGRMPAAGAVLVNDPFTDGSRTNTSGGDALGMVYFSSATTAGWLTVTNDPVLGSGNALRFAPTTSFGKFVGHFGPAQLLGAGDTLSLQFDIRFTTTPQTNLSQTLRLGLYDSRMTRTTSDGNTTPRYDDVGYGCVVSSPGVAGNNLAVFSELDAPTNDILGGATPGAIVPAGGSGASPAWSTNKQTLLLQLSRNGVGELTVQAQINGGLAAGASFAATNLLTTTFDEFAIGFGNTNGTFLIDNVQITSSTSTDSFDDLRRKWFDYLTGGTNLDLASANILSAIRTITNNATNNWYRMDKSPGRTFLWSDAASTTVSAHITTCYNRLLSMALAYAVTGSSLKGNTNLAADIISGLDWMDANRYNATQPQYDNWWDWEIGSPMWLNDICTLMYDQLTPAQLTAYMAAVNFNTPVPDMTAANLVWKARVVGVRGALVKDSAKLTACRDAFSTVFPYVTTGDGFFTDGSFLQHGKHPYTGGYGNALLGNLSPLLPWLTGSPWAIVDPAQTNVVNWVFDSYEPVLYRGAMMDALRGREPSRSGATDHAGGHSILQSILRIAGFAPPADALRMRQLVKYHAQNDSSRNFVSGCPLSLIQTAENLMNDTNVRPRAELTGHFQFPKMDRAVHLRPGYGLMFSPYSSRIYNYESINGENLHGWFTGSGMVYLYNNDLTHYGDSFWPTVNPLRLPGTTTPNATRTNGQGQSQNSSFNWAGGTVLDGAHAAYGVELGTQASTLTARKSWFCFDDEVVCLGAGITSGDTAVIETTAEQRQISTAGTNAFTVDGAAQATTLGWSNTFAAPQWAHLEGDVAGAAIGYYFPSGGAVKALREARTGAWVDINTNYSASPITRNYLTLWFDHGVKPTNATYAYTLLPGKTAAEVANYATSPDITVVENSSQAQAVRENRLGLLAVNFWNAATKTADWITCNNKASVVARESLDEIALSVSDPTQTNSGNLVLTLNRTAVSVISADAGVTVNQFSPTVQITVAMAGRNGQPANVRLLTYSNAAPVLAAVGTQGVMVGATLTVTNNASDSDIAPQQLRYSLLSAPPGASINATSGVVTWRPTMANAGGSNLFQVVVREAGWVTNLVATADAYVRDGSFSNSNFGTDVFLAARLGGAGFAREAYLRFPAPPSLRGTLSEAQVVLLPITTDTPGTQALGLVTNDTWLESTLTWSNRPGSGGALASWLPVAGELVNVPVLATAAAAQSNGSPVSYRLFATTSTASGLVNYAARENPTNPPALVLTSTNASPLAATQSFWAVVAPAPMPQLVAAAPVGNNWAMTINGAAGPDYLIETSTNLVSWQWRFTTNPAALPFLWVDDDTNRPPQRFYRVRLGP